MNIIILLRIFTLFYLFINIILDANGNPVPNNNNNNNNNTGGNASVS
jgi:hypothetical protein